MTPFAAAEYRRLRKLGERACWAKIGAETLDKFTTLENDGLARLDIRPDDCPDLSYLDQECFARDRDREYARANNDGVCGIVGQVRASEDDDWIDCDSVWGFIGDDWCDSGYDRDVMRACVDWHNAHSTIRAEAIEAARPDMYPH